MLGVRLEGCVAVGQWVIVVVLMLLCLESFRDRGVVEIRLD